MMLPQVTNCFSLLYGQIFTWEKECWTFVQNNFWAIPFPGQFLDVKWNWAKMAELTVFYLAGGIETNTTGTSRGRKIYCSYLLGEKKITLLLLSEARDNLYLTYCLIYYHEKSLKFFVALKKSHNVMNCTFLIC